MRERGHDLGLHRVLGKETLPQRAQKLDASLPIYQNELLIEVQTLNIDSASFKQIRQVCRDDCDAIRSMILQIISEKGKMHNPVTGSGGMLIGRVKEIGPHSPHRVFLGQRIATLVSLTLTPLQLQEITHIDLDTGQLQVKGHAILFPSGIYAILPDDLDDKLSLALFDVCGAPALVARHCQSGDRVLVVGGGKSGLLSAFAALDQVGKNGKIIVVDFSEEVLKQISFLGFDAIKMDATSIFEINEFLKEHEAFNLVINTSNVADSEMACVLAAKQRGKVIYFNMRTQFSAAVLGAEGLGKDVDLLMGNGYCEGHAKYVIDLVRKHESLKVYLESIYLRS